MQNSWYRSVSDRKRRRVADWTMYAIDFLRRQQNSRILLSRAQVRHVLPVLRLFCTGQWFTMWFWEGDGAVTVAAEVDARSIITGPIEPTCLKAKELSDKSKAFPDHNQDGHRSWTQENCQQILIIGQFR